MVSRMSPAAAQPPSIASKFHLFNPTLLLKYFLECAAHRSSVGVY
ncbi:hypothetical protein ACPOL_2956 [Acidisarcina polymorpha]|uniref:Uncharacterized protein n=1 Tax=Acidisarcina polymorpha TaxID=2211140 RepID=A0A2Z5FZH1_9BACT|nr:hypothetical protein ACPOL_2956 [Acidisarcina polymorpha]